MGVYHQSYNSENRNHNIFVYENAVINPHFHKNPEVIYVLDGLLGCICDGERVLLKKGQWGMCLPYAIHSFEPKGECRYWVCVFSTDYVGDFIKSMERKTGDFEFNCKTEVNAYLLSELVGRETHTHLSLKACLYALCGEYAENGGVRECEKDRNAMSLMARIVEYVSENHKKKLTLSDVARHVGYDYYYLSREFHAFFGISFGDFLSAYRMETVLELLKNSDMKIVDIAYESGFQSVRSLNNRFSSRFGMTPTEYRAEISGMNAGKRD